MVSTVCAYALSDLCSPLIVVQQAESLPCFGPTVLDERSYGLKPNTIVGELKEVIITLERLPVRQSEN